MMKKVIRSPPSSLRRLSPERPDTRSDLNSAWSSEIEGDPFNLEEPVDDDVGEVVKDNTNVDDGYCDTCYSDDFEDEEEENNAQEYDQVNFRTIHLDPGFRLLVPDDEDFDVSDDVCKIEILSAERRTELLSEFPHISDDILISDAYKVTDPGSRYTSNSSRSKLIIPVALPTTRLKHDDLFRFHLMAREKTGDWRKIQADHQNSELTFPLKDVKFFIAYAQPIPEFSNVTSSGFTFKSTKNDQINVEIPAGAVEGEFRLRVKVYPVNMDRMNAYRAFDPSAIDGIYALTDIMYVRHTMSTVLQRHGSVRLPLDRVDTDYEIKCLTETSGNYELVDIDKNKAVRNGQVEIPYTGNHKTSFQVVCVRPGASEDTIRRDAAYLNGQVDLCTILFFLSKRNEGRYLTVDFVDKTPEESVYLNRSGRGFYEIRNSRLCGVQLGEKRRIRVDLGGNMQSAELTKNTRFTFVYKSGCKNNSIEFRTAQNRYGMYYSIVKVLFDGKKVHEIHFNYPDVGQKLDEINNFFVFTEQRLANKMFVANTSDSGYNTARSGIQSSSKTKLDSTLSVKQTQKSLPKTDPKSKSETDLEPEPEPEQEPEPEPEPEPLLKEIVLTTP